MKEHPILFSAEMVQAILDGRKTQTRRPINPQPGDVQFSEIDNTDPVTGWQIPGRSGVWHDDDATSRRWKCPFGVPGDRLWVRETWKPTGLLAFTTPTNTRGCGRFVYKASPKTETFRDRTIPWIDGRHMPRWASRITLEITEIRVHRIQDISREDCLAEGITVKLDAGIAAELVKDGRTAEHFEFGYLWKNVYGNWEENPWVWAITFKRL